MRHNLNSYINRIACYVACHMTSCRILHLDAKQYPQLHPTLGQQCGSQPHGEAQEPLICKWSGGSQQTGGSQGSKHWTRPAQIESKQSQGETTSVMSSRRCTIILKRTIDTIQNGEQMVINSIMNHKGLKKKRLYSQIVAIFKMIFHPVLCRTSQWISRNPSLLQCMDLSLVTKLGQLWMVCSY